MKNYASTYVKHRGDCTLGKRSQRERNKKPSEKRKAGDIIVGTKKKGDYHRDKRREWVVPKAEGLTAGRRRRTVLEEDQRLKCEKRFRKAEGA